VCIIVFETTMSSYQTINTQFGPGGVAVCTFDRPEVRNALNEAMVSEVRAFLGAAAAWSDARAAIFTGAGEKAFLAGADVRELRDRTSADALRRINSGLFREVEQFPLPTIAAMRGVAVGGGLEFAIACDLRVCGEGTRMGQPETSIGIIPGAGATYRLPRLIGLGRAKDLIYTARIIDAQEALAIGLVNRVVDDESVLEAAHELAASVTRNGALALRLSKIALNSAPEIGVDAAMALESAAQAVLFDDEEKMRRMTDFLNKKK
jgi:enoyl-CoA hydratase